MFHEAQSVASKANFEANRTMELSMSGDVVLSD